MSCDYISNKLFKLSFEIISLLYQLQYLLFCSLEMSARQIRSEPTIVGVGRGGHRMEDLHYCYTCKLYFADASVFNIHGDVHSIRFECTCSICNEQLFSMGELALHYLQKHPDRRQGAMPSVRLSNDSCIVGRTSSMETKTSNEHLIR